MKMRWISVKEGYPELCGKESQTVLVYDASIKVVHEAEFVNDFRPRFLHECGEFLGVTHWMPTPPPPGKAK
jgi:hypothetical protein